MRGVVCILAAAGAGILAPLLGAQEDGGDIPAPSRERPAYATLRHEEDWSFLGDPARADEAGTLDRLKYIPLVPDAGIWLGFGGQARVRHETWNNLGFGAGLDRDDSLLLARLRCHADLHVTEYVRGFVEGKSALSTQRDLPPGERRPEDTDELELQNAFGDLILPLGWIGKLTLRAGRQELLFGKERLVSPLDWSNSRRAFDGFAAIFATGSCSLAAFYTQLATVRKYELNRSDSGTELFGLYGSAAMRRWQLETDLYLLGLRRDAAAVGRGFNGTRGAEDRYTLGGRAGGTIGETGLDYDLEGAYQLGEVGDGDVDAFMVTFELGFTPASEWCRRHALRLHGGGGYASGDRSRGGDVETFNQLFPDSHTYLGAADTTARQNLADFRAGLSVEPLAKLTTRCEVHYLLRPARSDALYDAAGTAVLNGFTGSSRDLGTVADLTLRYAFSGHLEGLAGYSRFFPGTFVKQWGSSKGADLIYLAAQWTF